MSNVSINVHQSGYSKLESYVYCRANTFYFPELKEQQGLISSRDEGSTFLVSFMFPALKAFQLIYPKERKGVV